MDDPLWKELTAFTREEVGGTRLFGKEPTLTPSTRILDDLRIDGVDAIEFVDKLFEKFAVEGDFPYARYIGPESPANILCAIPALICGLFNRNRPPHPDEHPLTLGMLYEAMRAGRWDTKEVEANQRKAS
ncbi:DUF1493 family protein [Paraburkholderia sp. PGU16]|uniref:Acyl carrier protein n=1 Tax=Paraburkholderia largidicola TaxID=3014751 RepID=A0A7I8BL93_9BURK|nr:DUF1493 family protein [Paraburkholderia sp. PGU16]BCF89536.1 hypothetical protein PPGU16_26030 [Paraburkholderia sp. PGU16]BEU22500.1 DUF1493 family protein [Paraburkholderia sp. 22B1P]